MPALSSPADLAERIARSARPLLVALDVDGTLAPLVPHPADSALLPGITNHLAALGELTSVSVAVVSGRQWHDLARQFDFPPSVTIVGSHGLEFGAPGLHLDPEDRGRLERLVAVAEAAAGQADGAWVEHKPAGVALHMRGLPPEIGRTVADTFVAALQGVDGVRGVEVLPGNAVVEAALHHYDKGEAVERLRRERHASTVVFVGDDRTDELAFARLGSDDIGVKVGGGDTTAGYRVESPRDVEALLALVAASLGAA